MKERKGEAMEDSTSIMCSSLGIYYPVFCISFTCVGKQEIMGSINSEGSQQKEGSEWQMLSWSNRCQRKKDEQEVR